MKRKHRKKYTGLKIILCLLCLILLVLLAVGRYTASKNHSKSAAPPPETAYEAFMRTMSFSPVSGQWGPLYETAQALRRCETGAVTEKSYTEAVMPFSITYLDPDKLFVGLLDEAQALLTQKAEAASRPDEIYDDAFNYKDEILDRCFEAALTERLDQAESCLSFDHLELTFHYGTDGWGLENGDALGALIADSYFDWDTYALSLRTELAETAEYIPFHYKIDENALAGPEPDPSLFGETADPAVIEELLQSSLARQLIGDQTLAWRADIAFLPGTSIYYYLDETILALVWKEETSKAVGTFSEVILADGSQLRRRIAGDQFESFDFNTTSGFAEQTNAVLTLGGDFYHHGRSCGIVVYQRDIYRYDLSTCDTCYITADGDMLFSYRDQFENAEQAQDFVKDNDILFSLCFGPVLIDNGVDVTPDYYPWGEIHDTYARSVLGMLGDKHYLTVNINCQQPNYYYLVTLRQAADAMVEKGCVKAYALDGGQTATTVFNGTLINPVQFGWEKNISDVIYFATAVSR